MSSNPNFITTWITWLRFISNYQTVHIDELIGPRGKNQKNMRDPPPTEVYEYAAEDADVTLKLKTCWSHC